MPCRWPCSENPFSYRHSRRVTGEFKVLRVKVCSPDSTSLWLFESGSLYFCAADWYRLCDPYMAQKIFCIPQRPLPIMHLLDHFHLRRTSSRDTDPPLICAASNLPMWRLVWLLRFPVRDHSQSFPLFQRHTLTHVHCFCRTQRLILNSFPQHMQNSFQNLTFLIFPLLKLYLASKWDVDSKLWGWN